MNLHLLPLLAALALPFTAQADGLKIAGTLSTGVGLRTHQVGGTLRELNNGLTSQSMLSLQGDEDLGGGSKASFNLESAVGVDTGTGGASVAGQGKFWNRQATVGLQQGPFTLTLGRQFTSAVQRVVDSLDVYAVGGSNAAAPLGFIGINRYLGDNRVDNSVKLGFKQGAFETSATVAAGEGRGRSFSGEAAYLGAEFRLAALGAHYDAPDALRIGGRRPGQTFWGLGAGTRIAGWDLIASYFGMELEALGKPTEGHHVAKFDVAHPMGRWLFKANFTHDRATDLQGVAGRKGSKQTWVASLDYFFARNVRAVMAAAWNQYSEGYRLDPLNIAALGRAPNADSTSSFWLGMRLGF